MMMVWLQAGLSCAEKKCVRDGTRPCADQLNIVPHFSLAFTDPQCRLPHDDALNTRDLSRE